MGVGEGTRGELSVEKGATLPCAAVTAWQSLIVRGRRLPYPGSGPVIDQVFPFASAAEAYEYLTAGSHFGKVVIRAGE
jgi:NADPH:quinone reductase-like Zn-dependent oxidoreductase